MFDKSKEELLKYLKDRYDKSFTARQMWQTRLQHLLITCGFVVTAAVSFLTPATLSLLDMNNGRLGFWLAIGLLVLLLGLLGAFGRAIFLLLKALSRIDVYVADADGPTFVEALRCEQELDADYVIPILAESYLQSIDKNTEVGAYVGNAVRKATMWVGWCIVGSLLLFVAISTVKILAVTFPPAISNSGSSSMSSIPEGSPQQPETTPSTQPAVPTTPQPAVTPATPSEKARPPIRVGPRPITGTEYTPPPTISDGTDPHRC